LDIGLYIWYWLSSMILAALLYRPVKKIIYVGRVRKFERRVKRESTEEERMAIEKKTIPIVVVLVITFAFLFNKIVMGKYFLGKR